MHVLYVDDEENPAKYHIRNIEKLPATSVHRCWNAEEAIEYLKSNPNPPVDIIISDYKMHKSGGHINGTEFAMKLHTDGSAIPFILVSADDWTEILKDKHLSQTVPAFGEAVTAFVPKMVASEKLIPTILTLTAPRIDPNRSFSPPL